MTDRYIPGVPCWTDAVYPDADAAARFYGDLFGWKCEDTMPDGAPGHYFMGRIEGEDVAAISSVPEGAPAQAVWNTYIRVDDADATTAAAVAAGATVITEPFDIFDAGRMAMFADPQGAPIAVWQPDQHPGAAVVNQHGAVNFNDLHTTDVDGAAAFYGAVFGWEVFELGSAKFWTMGAYGDHLEALQPGLRAQMASFGAPGFENVVATLNEVEAGAEPHWGLTFAVDDADAIAVKAAELGATVVSPPADAPWTRITVLQDPQGAVFTAGQFVAENAGI